MSFINFALSLIVASLIITLMVVGKNILLPLVIAIFFWYLINALAQGYKKIFPSNRKLRFAAAVLTFILVIWTPIELISETVPEVMKATPNYQINLDKLMTRGFEAMGVEQAPVVQKISESLNLGNLAKSLAGGLADFAGNAIMIIIYIIFLLAEQGTFSNKIATISAANDKKVKELIKRIYGKVQQYLLIKTILGIASGIISYAIMLFVGLDFAEFWALMIFFFSYIPNIGPVLAAAFPALLALVQFDTFYPFVTIVISIGTVQFIIGNVIEPRVMGDSLNLSALVILLSLVIWGTIWGIPGMFLCVPLTVIMAMVFAEFKKTRPIAVLLSSDGKID